MRKEKKGKSTESSDIKRKYFFGSEYSKLYRHYWKYGKDPTHFAEWNKGMILPGELDESKFFTSQDLFYIREIGRNLK